MKTMKDEVNAENYMDYIDNYYLALDMTDRTMQNEAKENGMPWTVAKVFV